jgi:hypothetical protein
MKIVLSDRVKAVVEPKGELSLWLDLAQSGNTDKDVDNLDQAIFLFGLGKLQELGRQEIETHFLPYWQERMDPEAWQVLQGHQVKTKTQTQ